MQLVDFPIALCADIMNFQVHVYTIFKENKHDMLALVKYSLSNQCDAHSWNAFLSTFFAIFPT